MSSRKRFTDIAAYSLAAVGTVAIVAALVIGLTGWPPTKAGAAPRATPGALGIGASTTGPVVLVETASEEKVTVQTTGTVTPALMVAAPKTLAPIAKAAAKRSRAKSVDRRAGVAKSRSAKGISGLRTTRASWYGPGFYGNTMAGGGRLTRSSMVVAHRSLPFGTRVQVTYRGRSVTAVVRDRGPFVGGRAFDLGPGTAKALGFSGVQTIGYRIL